MRLITLILVVLFHSSYVSASIHDTAGTWDFAKSSFKLETADEFVINQRPEITPCRSQEVEDEIKEAYKRKNVEFNPKSLITIEESVNGQTLATTQTPLSEVIKGIVAYECSLNKVGYSLLEMTGQLNIEIGKIKIDKDAIEKYLIKGKEASRSVEVASAPVATLEEIEKKSEAEKIVKYNDGLVSLLLKTRELTLFEKKIPEFPAPKKPLFGELLKLARDKYKFEKDKLWEITDGPINIIAAHAEAGYTVKVDEENSSINFNGGSWAGGFLFKHPVKIIGFEASASALAKDCKSVGLKADIKVYLPKTDFVSYVAQAVEKVTEQLEKNKNAKVVKSSDNADANIATFPKIGATFPFPVGPIIVTVEVGVYGDSGIDYFVETNCLGITAGIVPHVGIKGYASLSASVLIFKVGVEANVTVLSASLNLTGEAGLAINPENYWPEIFLNLNATANLKSLEGNLKVFAEINLLFDKKRFDHQILAWKPLFTKTYNIMDYQFKVGKDGVKLRGQDVDLENQREADQVLEDYLKQVSQDLQNKYYANVETLRSKIEDDYYQGKPGKSASFAKILEAERLKMDEHKEDYINKYSTASLGATN